MNWLTEPDEYRRLAGNAEGRALAYRELFTRGLAAHDLAAIRSHLNTDCALGSSRFQEEIKAMAGGRARIVLQGRPQKSKEGIEK